MTIESCRIPIIQDPKQATWLSPIKEFFDGYFYYGDVRYVIMPTNEREIRKLERVTGDFRFSTILKVVTFVLVIFPLIGVGFYLYNKYHQSTTSYRIFDEGRYLNPITVQKPVPRGEVPIPMPKAPGRGMRECLPAALGDVSRLQWWKLIPDYKAYINDNERFLLELLRLKRDLLIWTKGTLEKELSVNKEIFGAQELLTAPIGEILTPKNISQLKDEKDIGDVIEHLITQRIQRRLATETEGFNLSAELEALKVFKTDKELQGFIKNMISKLPADQLGKVVVEFKKKPESPLLEMFFSEFVKLEDPSEERPGKIKAVFTHFWDMWNKKVSLPHGNFGFFRALLYIQRDEDLKPMLETVPSDLDNEQLKDIAIQAASMIRTKGNGNLEFYKQVVKESVVLAPHFKETK